MSGVGWDWSAANQDDARTLEAALHAFVDFLNARYAWTPEQAVPPCWDRHGALIEELTTLMWSRWVAFQCPDATPDAAQTWHSYTLPSFLARVNYWLGSAGPECRAGQHQPSPRATLYPSRR